MFKTILCPLDGSDHARKALQVAIDLAGQHQGKLVLLHSLLQTAGADELERFAEVEGLAHTVHPELHRLRSITGRLEFGYDDEPALSSRVLVEIGQKVLDEGKRDAEEAGLRDVKTVLTNGDPAAQILRCVDEHAVDTVVMGSRGLSDVKAMFLGSVSHKVANHAPCTVIAVR